MSRFIQVADSHGSLKDIQTLINKYPDMINRHICEKIGGDLNICWKSPLAKDEYAEYRDNDFIKTLGISENIKKPLKDFWPINGPQWDALGNILNNTVFIIEAKANIPELVSPACGAGPKSKAKIENTLSEVKKYLNIKSTIDWLGAFYQYTNRIAHLYFLKVLNNVDTYLVFVYFINDTTVNGPKSKDEWRGAIQTMEAYLGINKNHKLRKYIIDVFIDIKDLKSA